MQIAVWADTRLAVARLILAVAPALSTGIKSASFAAEAQAWTLDLQQSVQIGQPVSVYEEDTGLYGSRLDFSIWYYPRHAASKFINARAAGFSLRGIA